MSIFAGCPNFSQRNGLVPEDASFSSVQSTVADFQCASVQLLTVTNIDVTGGVTFPNGSALAPSINFIGDTQTGLHWDDPADGVCITVAGADVMCVDTSTVNLESLANFTLQHNAAVGAIFNVTSPQHITLSSTGSSGTQTDVVITATQVVSGMTLSCGTNGILISTTGSLTITPAKIVLPTAAGGPLTGTTVLVPNAGGGFFTIASTAASATTKVFATYTVGGGFVAANAGILRSTVAANTFTITSTNVADNNTVSWMIIN